MVRPIVEYANTVWSPYTKRNISLLETVQRRAARFVFRDFSYSSSVTSMLQKLGWPTLEQRRRISKAIMLYKILNNLVAIPADKYTTPNNNYTRGHPQRLRTVSCRINVFLHSFFPSTIVIWNNLPSSVIDSNNIHEFKSSILNSL